MARANSRSSKSAELPSPLPFREGGFLRVECAAERSGPVARITTPTKYRSIAAGHPFPRREGAGGVGLTLRRSHHFEHDEHEHIRDAFQRAAEDERPAEDGEAEQVAGEQRARGGAEAVRLRVRSQGGRCDARRRQYRSTYCHSLPQTRYSRCRRFGEFPVLDVGNLPSLTISFSRIVPVPRYLHLDRMSVSRCVPAAARCSGAVARTDRSVSTCTTRQTMTNSSSTGACAM
jgi:hypothetical protein